MWVSSVILIVKAAASLVAVRLADHQDRAQFWLLAMAVAEHVQNAIHRPTGYHHSDANRCEHR